jgi:benzoate-CoA ligase family protein
MEIGFALPERYNASEVLFQNVTAGRGDHLAVIGPAGQRSYAQLAADAARWGHALLSLGLSRGDRVILLLDDTPVYPAAFFGIVRAGLVPILVNVLTLPDLLQFYVRDSGAKVALAEAAFCERFVGVCGLGGQLRTLIIVNGAASPAIPNVEIKQARQWLTNFPDHLPAADTHRNDMAFWMYSSGSTGSPKGIVHLQHDMAFTHLSYGRHVLKLTAGDICFSAAKIFFSYGFGNSITFPFSVGATSLLVPGRATAQAVMAAIAQYRPTVFFGLPTLYKSMIRAAQAPMVELSSLRLAVSAAELLPAEVAKAWEAMTGLAIVDCLGSTEMLNVYLSNAPERKKPGAVGVRVPGYEMVLKDENGTVITDGGEGILWIRGHSSTPLFWNRPDQTAQTIQQDGWLCTGDRFTCDDEGFYFYRGRGGDLVKVSGQWVNPIEVERCLSDHPAVRECAVLAIEMPDRSTLLKAFVVTNDALFDAQNTTRQLQDYVKDRLVPYKYPRIVQFMSELPKTGTGKIDRQALRKTVSKAGDGEVANV